jgi:hypothetical protein
MGGIVQRQRELAQRRNRKKKIAILKRKAVKANATEKAVLAAKIRRMTPGAEQVIANLGLEDRK